MKSLCSLSWAFLAPAVRATILWDGRFNDLSSSSDLLNWSWSNQVGPYQYYIHGSGDITEYVNLDPTYKNPADSGSNQGVKITLTDTAYWNGQNMRRTELIPQTSAAIASGKVFYHFSMKRSNTNPPADTREHQIAFFESHFTEMKSGWLSGASGTSDPTLKWCVSGTPQWTVTWEVDVWHNIAYEIDFSAGTVGFWHSTGSDALIQVVAPMSASTSSNGADWHLGVLELPRDGYSDTTEDFYFSGVYVENGSITTNVSGPGSSSGGSGGSSSSSVSTTRTSSTTPASTSATSHAVSSTTTFQTSTTTAAPAGGASHWGQCGGSGWTGPTSCEAPYTCSTLNAYYYQCL